MALNVFANGRTILHQGDGLTHVCAVPDVCKTPTPGGPVPIPYVNTASEAMLAKGAKKTKIGGTPIAIARIAQPKLSPPSQTIVACGMTA